MATKTVEQHAPPRKRARAATRRRPRGAKRPLPPLRRANAEAVAQMLFEGPYVLDARRLEMWRDDSYLTRREVLTAIDDLAKAGRVSIQVGRYGEREIGLTDPMREWRAAGIDVEEVPA